MDGVVTVYSSENPRVKLLPLTDEQLAAPQEFGAVQHFRTRIMPVLGTSPAVMGQAMAAFVLCAVAKQPFRPEPVAPMSIKARHKFAQHLTNREQRLFGNKSCIVDQNDIEFIVTEVTGPILLSSQKRELTDPLPFPPFFSFFPFFQKSFGRPSVRSRVNVLSGFRWRSLDGAEETATGSTTMSFFSLTWRRSWMKSTTQRPQASTPLSSSASN